MEPIRLAPNQPADRPYRGGAGILALRGVGSTDDHAPEDFVASVTTVHGEETVGLTILDDGRTLREAIVADPVGYLGAEHVDSHGTDTGLLVKLLSTGERLFDHVHPDAAFAATHLGEPRGKTEAWLITDTGDHDTGTVWIGFREEVALEQLHDWVATQDTTALLGVLNEVSVRAGDWVHVPAGTPHSIGPDITLVELQEPSDLSIILEYAPFPALAAKDAFLGLDLDTALEALDTRPWTAAELAARHGRAEAGTDRMRLLPREADAFFRAELITPATPVVVEPGFAVLVAIDGAGALAWDGAPAGELPIRRGDVLLVPHGAGTTMITGDVRVVRCAPPA